MVELQADRPSLHGRLVRLDLLLSCDVRRAEHVLRSQDSEAR